MKRRMRLLLATATGVAVLVGGAGLSSASASVSRAAYVAADDITNVSVGNAYVPADKEIEVSFSFALANPLGPGTGPTTDADKVTITAADITPAGKSAKAVTTSVNYPAHVTGESTAPRPASASGTGKFTISKDDPAGDWTLRLQTSRGNTSTFTVKVAGKQGITGASVTPNPVNLVKGQEVKVTVQAAVKDATLVSAKMVSDTTSEYYDLGSLELATDGYYTGTVYFTDDSAPGDWTLEISASRGGETLKGVGSFSVNAPEGGASKKSKSKITLSAPNKAKLGKTFKIYGKVYRGTKAYKGKVVEVYFKKKGTKSYKFMGFAKATSTGKYTKTVKQKYDGYWRTKVPATSKTHSSWSAQEFVDVK
ncbi:hypothetical protein ACFXJ8_30395 [Nonomuraea sp. NPDC059194]|uniref:hypothetical protein n=1 Tax=Nonomuraea sp. NPDC059194 TaxID=3346764 RepID=UPI0036B844CA